MPKVCQKVPTAFPWYQYPHSSQQTARAHLNFEKRESIIFMGRGGRVADAATSVAGGATVPVADDAAEVPVADAAEADAAASVAGGATVPVADDAAEEPVADDVAEWFAVDVAASADNAAKDSQTGQTFPLHGPIAGTTWACMVA